MIDWLIAPLAYGFMQRGFMASLMVGVLCAIVGCYVVLRSMAFLGDAMAHAILPGVAVAYLFKANLLVGALAAVLLGDLDADQALLGELAIDVCRELVAERALEVSRSELCLRERANALTESFVLVAQDARRGGVGDGAHVVAPLSVEVRATPLGERGQTLRCVRGAQLLAARGELEIQRLLLG